MVGELSADAVRKTGIVIHDEITTIEQLVKNSPQAKILAQFLLDFKQIVPHERWVSQRMQMLPLEQLSDGTMR